jgi:hypothetical protein
MGKKEVGHCHAMWDYMTSHHAIFGRTIFIATFVHVFTLFKCFIKNLELESQGGKEHVCSLLC